MVQNNMVYNNIIGLENYIYAVSNLGKVMINVCKTYLST